MGGSKQSQEKLNHTLKYITTLLIQSKITNWFVGYGTLLGIVRDQSCIDNDDDVDIICDANDFDKIHQMLRDHHLEVTYRHAIADSRHIIKTVTTSEWASVDFYCATVDAHGNFHDHWENVVWTECYQPNSTQLQAVPWNGIYLPLPDNAVRKLKNRYGADWRTPCASKGPMPRRTHL